MKKGLLICLIIFGIFQINAQVVSFDFGDDANTSGKMIKFYPNPLINGQTLTVVYKANEPCVLDIEILDVIGNPIKELEYTIDAAGEHAIKINDSNLDPGNYMIKLVCGTYYTMEKLIVK